MPYHKYVFDAERRKFVGKFEEMYQNEDMDGYDSWHSSDLTHLPKKIHLCILESYNFNRILDFGCGKGAFTHLLKKQNNYVLGVDVSKAAIEKAKTTFQGVDFSVINKNDFTPFIKVPFDLVLSLETLSYIEEWRSVIRDISGFTKYIYISLYIPEDPIGFVKSQDDLIREVERYFTIEEKIVYNSLSIFLLGKIKAEGNK
jgi:SAM-dependent methyltransferase